jgi:hypothetical protein
MKRNHKTWYTPKSNKTNVDVRQRQYADLGGGQLAEVRLQPMVENAFGKSVPMQGNGTPDTYRMVGLDPTQSLRAIHTLRSMQPHTVGPTAKS